MFEYKIDQTFILLLRHRYNKSVEAAEVQLAEQLAGSGIFIFRPGRSTGRHWHLHIPTWQTNWQALAFSYSDLAV
jgi:hypothetical protein